MTKFELPTITFKTPIRSFEINGITVGGENSLPFTQDGDKLFYPKFAIEILLNIPLNYPSVLKSYWGESLNNTIEWAEAAAKIDADFLAIEFNVDENDLDNEIAKSKDILKKITAKINKPLIISGCAKPKIDEILLPELAKSLDRQCIIGPLDDKNYKSLAQELKNHVVIAKTPIDINLSKELNILISEQGGDSNKILIDPTMAGLGYGLDYAYSIVEKIKLAGLNGDLMLNMPIITFAGKEAWKTKEAKSDDFDKNWGSTKDRAIMWECMTASSILSAGSNIIVMWHPEAISAFSKYVSKV